MKNLTFNLLHIAACLCTALVIFQEQWLVAILSSLLLILLELGQIHSTIKAAHGSKE